MPRKGIKVKYLRTERFRNKKSVIKIDFYERLISMNMGWPKSMWNARLVGAVGKAVGVTTTTFPTYRLTSASWRVCLTISRH